jgi:hypothetical protein
MLWAGVRLLLGRQAALLLLLLLLLLERDALQLLYGLICCSSSIRGCTLVGAFFHFGSGSLTSTHLFTVGAATAAAHCLFQLLLLLVLTECLLLLLLLLCGCC